MIRVTSLSKAENLEKGTADEVAMSTYIIKQCKLKGLKFNTENEEAIFDHHIQALTGRLINNQPLDLIEYDKDQIDEASHQKSAEIAQLIKEVFGYQLSGIEQFLIGTYFQLYK